ncbi:MAG: hypothetical protein C5B59_00510 [Bacteroidetes bacterium]|nr:MAG: hypothetical protein C5B59_00510 [Bacteroidota bacterium]
MSNRNRVIGRRLLKQLLKEGHSGTLKGSQETASVLHQAAKYLAQLKLTPASGQRIPPSLNRTIAEARKIASNKKLGALIRLKSIRHLLLVEGLEIPPSHRNSQELDSVESLIRRELDIEKPERETVTAQKIRDAARRNALADVIRCFEQDRANRCFKTLSDVTLRLPEMPAPDSGMSDEARIALEELRRKYDQSTSV